MAEPRTRARRKRRPATIATLLGAMITIALAGLFFARPAAAATSHAAATTQTAQSSQSAQTVREVQPGGGVCSVPGIGDIGELAGFCGAGSGAVGDINNVCTPSVQQPEQAATGVDSMVAPPGTARTSGGKTLYDNYGVAGQNWNAYGLQCSDMTSLIGNNVASMVFDVAKSLDRVTITVYQSAAGNGILQWLQGSVNTLITAIGNAIFFPYLAVAVLIGVGFLAWQGLVRKRASRTMEGTIWMVVAAVAAIWLIGQPSTFTGVGANVSNGVTQVLNAGFARLPAPSGGNCLPVHNGDQQSVTQGYAFTSSSGMVDHNANELWSVLVCKPWLEGELGSTAFATSPTGKQTVVNQYGRQLLWAQAIAANEQPTQQVITAKKDTYVGIAKSLQANQPAIYPLFQGNQWTTRMEIGFSALFASLVAGLLVLLISLTLIVLKLGWLLLLIVGPFFLLVGINPGFGRVVAMRWFEMLVGVLLKQVAISLVLSVLLYCYSLIMGTADAVLPWALKILMIALVTVAVWIYRKPFSHLFSSVGYGMIGSSERAEFSYREASTSFRRATSTAAGAAGTALPGVAAYRASRWARRSGAAPDAGAAAGASAAGAAAGTAAGDGTAQGTRAPARLRPDGVPVSDDSVAGSGADGGPAPAPGGSGAGSAGGSSRSKQWPESGSGSGRAAPPLPLPEKERLRGGSGSGSSSAGWAKNSAGWSGAGSAAGTSAPRGQAPARPPSSGRSPGAGSGAPGRSRNGGGNGGSSTPPTRASGSSASAARSRDSGPDVASGRDAKNAPSPARFWQRRTK
ncbi:MAG: type IV secretion system protein [Streptosporangiales bacterium]|nr:type IV secretion system protein [Streptosporangiales bacterium]